MIVDAFISVCTDVQTPEAPRSRGVPTDRTGLLSKSQGNGECFTICSHQVSAPPPPLALTLEETPSRADTSTGRASWHTTDRASHVHDGGGKKHIFIIYMKMNLSKDLVVLHFYLTRETYFKVVVVSLLISFSHISLINSLNL